jgi:orotate phosphoribosyltransferase
MLSQLTGIPALFVRKEAKTYGTCRLAEGGEVDGRRLTIVEDVVTSGGQVILSARDLRERGAVVEHAVIVIDRRGPDHQDQLAEAGIELRALYTMDELKRAGEA